MLIEGSSARKRTNLKISPSASRGRWPDRITSVTAMAPALMKGLRGLPRSNSSWTMELNGLPDGSRPTRCHRLSPILPSASVSVKTLETLWMENGVSAVAARATLPWASTTTSPKALGSTLASSGM